MEQTVLSTNCKINYPFCCSKLLCHQLVRLTAPFSGGNTVLSAACKTNCSSPYSIRSVFQLVRPTAPLLLEQTVLSSSACQINCPPCSEPFWHCQITAPLTETNCPVISLSDHLSLFYWKIFSCHQHVRLTDPLPGANRSVFQVVRPTARLVTNRSDIRLSDNCPSY